MIKICKFWLNYVYSDLNAAKTELKFSMCKSVNFDPNNTKKYLNNVKYLNNSDFQSEILEFSQNLHILVGHSI